MARSNLHGFDFLRSEHTLSSVPAPSAYQDDQFENSNQNHQADSEQPNNIPDTSQKNDLEKQFDVMKFLRTHRSSGCILPSIIHRNTGVDLTSDIDESVSRMLERNPKIRIEEIPDPENPSLTVKTFGYQAKFNNIRDKTGLLAQINRCKNGVAAKDLGDAYEGVEEDLTALVTAGDVLAIYNPEDKDRIMFPRGESFLVELDGHVVLPAGVSLDGGGGGLSDIKDLTVLDAIRRQRAQHQHNQPTPKCPIVETDVDPRKQIRRGEAVWVAGTWFRVSSAVQEGVPLSKQPARAQAPPSVVLRKDLSKKNDVDGYIRPLDDRRLPLDGYLSQEAMEKLSRAKKAKDKLLSIVHSAGGRGGASAQLLSSNAGSTNPEKLAMEFAAVAGGAHAMGLAGRRRAGAAASSGANSADSPKADKVNPTYSAASAAAAKENARAAASDPSLVYCHARRHGCTKDVRQMYLETRADVPDSDVDLYNAMIEHKLLDPGEPMRLPRMKKKNANVDNDGKPKKRRYYERKNNRMTNTHLMGTEIGAVLARAAEKQQQGKSVGDGGM